MKVKKTPLWDGDRLGGQACVSVDIAPLAGQDNPRHTNLDKKIRQEASLRRLATLWKWAKIFFLNLRGTIGRKTPVETSAARRWAPVWRKANLRDGPPSKRCLSGQGFCSAAISSRSIGSAAAIAATVSVDFGRGRDRKSAITFFKPGKYTVL